MLLARVFSLLILPSALVAASRMSGPSTSSSPPAAEFTNRFAWVYYAPSTPLDQIPVYSLPASAPQALTALEAEIERLYTHSKSLPLGHDRRVFQTRIYLLEKQLRPLTQNFDATAWETLRTAVKLEWETVQTTLVPVAPTSASPGGTTDERLAAIGATR
jgi:hypothetical protein